MKVININDTKAITEAVAAIRDGGVVVYPTDTAYGLGVDALNIEAVERMYAIKGRELDRPTHVVVADIAMAQRYAVVTDVAQRLASSFLPGPLSLVLEKRNRIPDDLVAHTGTVGIRIPDNDFALSLSRQANTAITTPSANKAGDDAPYTINAVEESFGDAFDQIDVVIDAGELPRQAPSTFVDLTGEEATILREGPITEKQIASMLE